jgi:hypothetical protein
MRVLACAADAADKKLAAFLRKSLPEGTALETVSAAAFSRSFRTKAPGSFVYFLASGLGQRKVLALAAKLDQIEDCSWGVLDPSGESEDPAEYFFAGGRDYIGARLFKAGAEPERLAAAVSYASRCGDCAKEAEQPALGGWDGLAEGRQIEVRFCYAALADRDGLAERIGEARLGRLREEFAAFLESWSKECGGIVWIRDSGGCLLLFPPEDVQANPVLCAFKLLLDRALIGYEGFRLSTPISFRFVFHAGRTTWRKPGATGTVVSEDVNYAFHLGQRAVGDGQVIISEAAASSIPSGLRDLFCSAGTFEGHGLTASRRFIG